MTISYIIGILLFTFIFNHFGTYITIKLAKKEQFYEKNNARKIHIEKVAALGGIPIFLTLVISYFMFMEPSFVGNAILFACVLLLGIGIWDDIKNIGVKRRLSTHFLVANIAYLIGFQFIATSIPPFIIYGLTIGFIVLMINGMNFLDGINGLVGGIGLLATLVFSFLFYQTGHLDLVVLTLAFAGALMGFLWYNFGNKAAIFMGDNGSTILGFLLAILALKLWSIPIEATPTLNIISISLVLIGLPLLDLFGVIVVRLSKRQSPFQADRMHIHHLLTDSGQSHPEASIFLLSWLISMIGIFYFDLISSTTIGAGLIISSYLVIRLFFTKIKSPSVSVAKWDKPARHPAPIP